METLESAVAGSCPLAFAGASGGLFVKAVTALVAAHCGIIDDHQWPEDEADKILHSKGNLAFDFIIVGAGTAGSIVASRLCSHFPSKSVLLIEAGDNPGLDSEVPALLFLNQDASVDWHYKTYSDDKSCLGFENNSCTWSKGRAMGGSGSINAMLYIRGHPNDYSKWHEDGNPGWSYNDVKPYFDALENRLELQHYKHNENPWYDTIKAAWKELNFDFYSDSNETKIGTRITKLLTKNGKRLNAAKVYLSDRANNMHVMKNTIVQKIIIDPKTKTANYVQIRHLSGKTMNISVNIEVVLSAGSIATPQILMLSSIGPKTHLNENQITCLTDLSVGKNLQDHVLLPVFLKTKLHNNLTPQTLNSFLLQYMMARSGPFSNIGITDFMGFIDTEEKGYPNIQFHHTYFTQNDSFTLEPYLKGVGYKTEIITLIKELNKESDLLGIYPTLLHPISKGEILLADFDPKSKPIIKSNYFDKLKDLESILNGVRFIQKLVNTNSFKALNLQISHIKIPGCLKFSFDSDDYWKCYIKYLATTIYHPVGTAKMGPKEKEGVVDENLLVYGIKNLRVVDASIMPKIISGNTMAATMMIAEKAADIITKYYTNIFKDEL